MSFQCKLNLRQTVEAIYVVVIQNLHTVNDMWVLFQLNKLTIEYISAFWENVEQK